MSNLSPLLDLDEALALLEAALPSPLHPAVRSDRDDPTWDRSAMDGVALRAAEGRVPRRVVGTLFAGEDPRPYVVEPGTCLRIMTGACLPAGADAVVPVEALAPGGSEWLEPLMEPKVGDHVRRRASQAREGDLLLPAGWPGNAVRTGLRAQVGEPLRSLVRIPVGVASTGDELSGEVSDPWRIRDSNGPMLAHLVHLLGGDARLLPALPDDLQRLEACFRELRDCGECRVILTSGGVSMGEKDLLPEVLEGLGARLLFHRIRLKPGKPMLAALLGDLVVLGLPGNPVSAYLNARLFLPGVLARLEGRRTPELWRRAALMGPVANPSERPLLHPCALEAEGLRPLWTQGSGDLVTLAKADACAWIPEGGLEGGEARYLELV